jgi:VanZ family protein
VNAPNRLWPRALAPVALMGAIFYFSSQPAGGDYSWLEVVARKLGHVTGYAALAALWTWALWGGVRHPIRLAALIALAYACTDEYHQSFIDTRHSSPVDVGIDAIGIALAAMTVKLVWGEPRAESGPRSSPAPSP